MPAENCPAGTTKVLLTTPIALTFPFPPPVVVAVAVNTDPDSAVPMTPPAFHWAAVVVPSE